MKTHWKSLSLLGSRLLFAVLLLCICCNDEEIPLTVACFSLSTHTAHVGDTIVFKDCSIAEKIYVAWESPNGASIERVDSSQVEELNGIYFNYKRKVEGDKSILDTSARYAVKFRYTKPGIYRIRMEVGNPYSIISCSGVAGANIEEDTKIDTLTILK